MRFLLLVPILLFANIDIVSDNLELTKKSITTWVDFRDKNLVKQNYDYSCGSSSLATILKYFYNLDVSEEDILKEIISKDIKEKREVGLSFFELGEFVKKFNLKAIGLEVSLETLKSLKIPVIVYIKIRKSSHFSVFRKIDRKYIYLADPTFGNIKIRVSKFKEMFYHSKSAKNQFGKILAILPTKSSSLRPNSSFLKRRDLLHIIDKTLLLNPLFD